MRATTEIWDHLVVPGYVSDRALFRWLSAMMPGPTAHDYILSTDGSGAKDGIGAAAAVIGRVDYLADGKRGVVERDCFITANYGETVQRNELQAFISGVRQCVTSALEVNEGVEKVSDLVGEDRVRILWYTDRRNLAASFLFRENGDLINARNTDKDLWAQWSYYARHVCVTPICLPRNEEKQQELCDGLCTIAREAMKGVVAAAQELDAGLQFGPRSQKAMK